MRFGIRGKLLIFAAGVWIVIFGIYSAYIYKERIKQTQRMALMSADLLAKEIVADRQVYTSTVISIALKKGLKIQNTYEDDTEDSIPLPATFVNEVFKSHQPNGRYYIDLVSLDPINPSRKPKDDFQLSALRAFINGTHARYYRFEDIDGRQSLRFMIPDVAISQVCVDCHNNHQLSPKRDYKVGDVMGGLEIVVPVEEEMMVAMTDIWRSIGYGFVVVVVMGLVGLAFIRYVVTSPILDLVDTSRYLAGGDLTRDSRVDTNDEIGFLAVQINEVLRNLNNMIREIRHTSDEAVVVSIKVRDMSRYVVEGSSRQASALDSISSSMEKINTSVARLAKATEVLAASTESGSASVQELRTGINDIVGSMEHLFSSLDDTATSTRDMSLSIKEVSENIDNLSSAIVQVSSSMNNINAMIKEVESNAMEADRFADDVIEDARTGMNSVERTMDGIERIRGFIQDATIVINTLKNRVTDIGRILDVIQEVAEDTNLLALNAAIIAAQSGEQGKSFSVVAGEIKDLAERTTTSTKEVSEIIGAIERETSRAVRVMEKGQEYVEEGVYLSKEAREALTKIVNSARRSTTSVHEIARTTVEQTKRSRMVVDATERVAEMTRRIVNAIHEQARKSDHINKSTEQMIEIAFKVKGATKSQAEANEQITKTMEEVNRMVAHINTVIREQSKSIFKIHDAIEAVRRVSVENIQKANETDRAVKRLVELNNKLMENVRKFKLKNKST